MADDTVLDAALAVDGYIEASVVAHDDALIAAMAASDAAGLPSISVTPSQGMLLHLLARMQGATRILEIGTLGGYSTIWLARALPPDGQVVTLELDPKHAEVAASNLRRAGVADRVDLRIGKALDLLPSLEAEGQAPFDLIFIDADKVSAPEYFEWSLKLSRPGTAIVVDNVVRQGALVQSHSTDVNVVGMRRLVEFVRSHPAVTATITQTVGAKGYDGFLLALVS